MGLGLGSGSGRGGLFVLLRLFQQLLNGTFQFIHALSHFLHAMGNFGADSGESRLHLCQQVFDKQCQVFGRLGRRSFFILLLLLLLERRLYNIACFGRQGRSEASEFRRGRGAFDGFG